MGYEKLTIVGHIGSSEEKVSPKGVAYVRLSVAVDRGKHATVWYTVLLLGPLGERARAMLPFYSKGRLVLVEGRPRSGIYQKRDGTQEIDHVLLAAALPELLDYKSTSSS